MEDYEYLHLLKTIGEEAYAQEQLAVLVTNTYTWNWDPLDLYAVREKIAARIAGTGPGDGGDSGGDSGLGEIPGGEPGPGNTRPNAALAINADPGDPWNFSFDGTGSSDAEGAIASYEWTFGDGSTATGAQVTHRYESAGSYNVTLAVSDAEGISETVSVAISVTGEVGAPVAQWFAESAASGGLHYTFDGSASLGGDGALTTYEWDLGDRTVMSGAKVEHRYSKPGTYQVKLTVKNDKQKSATAVYSLKVGDTGDSSGGGGGGGGCSLGRNVGPTDFKQGVSFLLLFSAPFWGSLWRRVRKCLV